MPIRSNRSDAFEMAIKNKCPQNDYNVTVAKGMSNEDRDSIDRGVLDGKIVVNTHVQVASERIV